MGLSPSGRPAGLNAIPELAEDGSDSAAAGVIEKVKCAAAAAASGETGVGGEAGGQVNGEEPAVSR